MSIKRDIIEIFKIKYTKRDNKQQHIKVNCIVGLTINIDTYLILNSIAKKHCLTCSK